MLTRLAAADALSLHSQTSTTPAHTVTLIVIEGSDRLSHARLHQLLASSLPRLARLRSRLVGKPFGIGRPVWAEIDGYDATPQLHRATVQAPGGPRELAELIAALSAGPRDGRQPLWEAWSIDGLAGQRWGVAMTTSPVLGAFLSGAASVWPALLTYGPYDPNIDLPDDPSLGPAPSLAELVYDAVSEIVENHVTGVWLLAEAGTGAIRSVCRRLRGREVSQSVRPAASSMNGPVPHTLFNPPLTRRRAVAFASTPLADVETVSNAFGGSTANVLLAACTLSLRAWLQRYDTLPGHPLLMQVPLSLRGEDPVRNRNAFAVGEIRLPVQLDDPVQILTDLHTAAEMLTIARRDDTETANPAVDFATIASLVPPPVARAGIQVYRALRLRRGRTPVCHGRVSYIAGSPIPGFCAGARVVGMHTAPPLSDGAGLNITMTAHNDVMDLCVSACPDNVPAVDEIACGIAESVDSLVAAAQASPRGRGRSVVTELTTHVAKDDRRPGGLSDG